MGLISSFAVVVPTLNPGQRWSDWLTALKAQSARPCGVLVVDSSSNDGSFVDSQEEDFELVTIPRDQFNHGATRQTAFERFRTQVEVVVFMTQDALLTDEQALARLTAAFNDSSIAAAYGRQLPHAESGPFGSHARLFNYGADSVVKGFEDRDRLGIKTCFLSNSFAAYRCRDLEAIGGFPMTDFGEDMLVAARLLLYGRRIAYVADACVYHSHDYSIREEFDRYFATGRFHARHTCLLNEFGGATGEGRRFAWSEMAYLMKRAPHLLPAAVIRTLVKYSAYQFGRRSLND